MIPLDSLIGSSTYWTIFFRQNAEQRPVLPWHDEYQIDSIEREIITPSIQQFELGERAQGRSFLARAAQYAEESGDYQFVQALKLFIKEENRHSSELRRFMEIQNIPRLTEYWSDGVFRKLRKLAGLELMVSVLVTAEIIAMSYYRALRGATKSPLLQKICAGILKDEVWHLKFQGMTLAKLRRSQGPVSRGCREALHFGLLCATAIVVWRDHRRVYKAGGFSFIRFLRRAKRDYALVTAYSRRKVGEASLLQLHSIPMEIRPL